MTRAAGWRRPAAVLLVAMTAMLLAVGPSGAQIPDLLQNLYGVEIEASPTTHTFDEGEQEVFVLTVRNTGQFPLGQGGDVHRIDLTAPAAPEGWLAELEFETVTIPPDESTQVKFTVRVAENPSVTSWTAQITATVNEPLAGDPPPSDSVAFAFDSESPTFSFLGDLSEQTILLILAGVGGLVILVAVLATRKKGQVELHCPEPAKDVPAGSGTSYPVLVENRKRGRETVALYTSEAPPGWETFLPLAELTLAGGEQETIWLSVKAPRTARSGDQVLVKVVGIPSSNPDAKSVVETMTTVAGPGGQAPRSEWDESVLETEAEIEESPPAAEPSRRVAVKKPRSR